MLGQLLLAAGAVDRAVLDRALDEQRRGGRRLGEILVRAGATDEEAVVRALGAQLALPVAAPPLEPEEKAARLLPAEVAREKRVLPLALSGRSLRLAMADPLDLAAVDDVQFRTGHRVEPVVASGRSVAEGLARAYGAELGDLLESLPPDRRVESAEDDLERAARSAPVVRLVDHVLERAVAERASDVHIEQVGRESRVRFRVDGVLRTALRLPPASHAAVLSRIKIMAGMDISVKRRPQDGGFQLRPGGSALALRVSTLPLEGGEKAVIRILDPSEAPRDLAAVGLSAADLGRFRSLLSAGQGVILVAGPTGSGKSSTLFGALTELDREALNVTTLEDPVEYRLPGACQVQVERRGGLTFPAALRSVLRQDPDVVMVGEIRDRETAEIAMAAAVTGHLVLSTIHTTDAPAAITRLLDMGVPPYLMAGGLAGVVAQRLVRRACPSCRGDSAGCSRCAGGYRGRTGVFQILVMSDALREAVVRGVSTPELRRLSGRGGMGSLLDDARRKVAEGVSTPHEVGRVLREDPGSVLPCGHCGGELPADADGCPGCGRPRVARCRCGRELRAGWRFCPGCLRPVGR